MIAVSMLLKGDKHPTLYVFDDTATGRAWFHRNRQHPDVKQIDLLRVNWILDGDDPPEDMTAVKQTRLF